MNLLGKATNPEFWKEVREKDCYKKFREELFENWTKHCEVPIYALKYSDFRLFVVTGDRGTYERTYFTRRQALNTSALLSLIYPEEEKYIVRLMDTIYAICDEYTWCLPAHQTKLEVNNNIHLDLFACETGNALSEIYTLLGDRLEELIRDRIRIEIDRRIITAYTNGTKYGWEKCDNNWAAVCLGSVGTTVMLMRPDLFEQLKPRFDATMEAFLSGFKDDGICLEGFGYWHYGFGFFTVYADMVKTFTNGETDYFKREKVKTISTFIQKMMLTENCTVSFSDGGRRGNYHIGVLHYLKNKYPDDVEVGNPKYSYNYDGCGRWCLHLRSAIWLDENLYYNPDQIRESATYYAPNSEWLVRKTPAYSFAAKGGYNAEPHNQNDIGTFIVAKKGRQLLMDVGAGAYTRQYFAGDTRYTIFACSSRGHSVPIFDGNLQKTGRQYKATTKYENEILTVEFAAAYDIPELKKCERKFSFTNDKITVTDNFDYSGKTIVDRIVTLIKPEISGETVTVEDVTIHFDSSKADVAINTDLHNKETAYLIDFTLKDGVREFSFDIK